MPMYLNNVPLANQRISDTQAPINQNFVTIDTAFQVDHIPYTLTDQGFHNKVTFPTSISTPSLAGTQVVLYQSLYNKTNRNELWFERSVTAGNGNFPITAALKASTGWTTLPSGMIFKWGTVHAPGSTTVVTLTSVGSPDFSVSPFAVLITNVNSAGPFGATVGLKSIDSATQFTAYCTNPSVTTDFTYLAIGSF